jgi:hypothetical protein
LEAYLGRGNNDALESRDIEDILSLVDGREELTNEIKSASKDVKEYIALQIGNLLQDPNFQYAVQSQAQGSAEREDVIYECLETLASVNQ